MSFGKQWSHTIFFSKEKISLSFSTFYPTIKFSTNFLSIFGALQVRAQIICTFCYIQSLRNTLNYLWHPWIRFISKIEPSRSICRRFIFSKKMHFWPKNIVGCIPKRKWDKLGKCAWTRKIFVSHIKIQSFKNQIV